jgi:hypothetical protein
MKGIQRARKTKENHQANTPTATFLGAYRHSG